MAKVFYNACDSERTQCLDEKLFWAKASNANLLGSLLQNLDSPTKSEDFLLVLILCTPLKIEQMRKLTNTSIYVHFSSPF